MKLNLERFGGRAVLLKAGDELLGGLHARQLVVLQLDVERHVLALRKEKLINNQLLQIVRIQKN